MIIIGPQGCGKGTQAKRLSKNFNIPHISTGDIFREIRKEDTLRGRKVKELIDNGMNVPDKITIPLVKEKLSKLKEGYILDGFPRNIEQSKSLEGIDKVIYLKISDKEVVRRIEGRRNCKKCGAIFNITTAPKPKIEGICNKCGSELFQRDDDKPGQIKKRLKQYHNLTAPLIEFYKDILIEIDGSRDIGEVYSEIISKLSL
ncbi:nucleoside monophosphate kinase [archaeon]|jgi:adenylate kinase|nr:nucleoside monophosphate kinase [archaeon]MBT6823982.1 nucleoside monophosphate kinase [archaeon]MBT7106954.1 nucleoside monophosphate kinase [archaeon]MBT7297360.1 nucleoside monophosphate kinase [archaeon]